MKSWKIIVLWLIFSLSVGLAACEKEGPAGKAGKKIDKAIEKAGNKLEEAGDKIKEETEK